MVSSWHTEISTKESPAAFARRIAALAVEKLERENAALRAELEGVRKATEEVRRYLESTMPDGAAAEIMRPFDAAIRRRGKP